MDIPHLTQRVLEGERRALARVISLVESGRDSAAEVLASLFPYTGHAHRVGVAGSSGSGKSTLVNALAKAMRRRGLTVGIAAVDPTSPFTGGAILGDRIRMQDLAGDPGIFIRSMATRGSLGGLARATSDVVGMLDAAGFDVVLIETVGVGQSEVDIARAAHTTIVIEAPGLGDDIQAIKAGILEVADILVVNKADHPHADNTWRALRAMLDLSASRPPFAGHHGALAVSAKAARERSDVSADEKWAVRVLKTVATTGEGIEELLDAIQAHRAFLVTSGTLASRVRAQVAADLEARLHEALLAYLVDGVGSDEIEQAIEQVFTRQVDPYTAAAGLIRRVLGTMQG